jgi:hypothetical protein
MKRIKIFKYICFKKDIVLVFAYIQQNKNTAVCKRLKIFRYTYLKKKLLQCKLQGRAPDVLNGEVLRPVEQKYESCLGWDGSGLGWLGSGWVGSGFWVRLGWVLG